MRNQSGNYSTFLRTFSAVLVIFLVAWWILVSPHWVHRIYTLQRSLGIPSALIIDQIEGESWVKQGFCLLPASFYQWDDTDSTGSNAPRLPFNTADECPILTLWGVNNSFIEVPEFLSLGSLPVLQENQHVFVDRLFIQTDLLAVLSPRAPPLSPFYFLV